MKRSPTLSSMLSYFAQLDHFSSSSLLSNKKRQDIPFFSHYFIQEAVEKDERNNTNWFVDSTSEEEKVESSNNLSEKRSADKNAKKGGILRAGPVSNRTKKETFKIALSDEEEERLSQLERSGKKRLHRQGTKCILQEEEEERKKITSSSQKSQTKNPMDNPKLLVSSEPSPLFYRTPRVETENRGISPFKKSTISQKDNRGSSAPQTPLHTSSAPPEITRTQPHSEKKLNSKFSLGQSVSPFKKSELRNPRGSLTISSGGIVQQHSMSGSRPPRVDKQSLRKSFTSSPHMSSFSEPGKMILRKKK